jgi:Tol biopolymer transport system component
LDFNSFLVAAAGLVVAAVNPGMAEPATGPAAAAEADFLSRVRQLTFEGRRAGEGYFSPDGSRMVFQSEREPGNPFFQIYVLDLETGDTHRVSPGIGKTTCPFIRPASGEVLFASTHHDPASEDLQREELDFRASGEERRYAWDFDPEMDLYVAAADSRDGVGLKRLTNARGYDAEASYSPDGKWIVFASTRQAYERALTETEKKQLEIDPSYFAELYVMRADGSDLRRITDKPGYDGGPFFSPDGERVIWRSFDTEGLIADVWSARMDGSDPRQLTDFESMSWAPYPHPSGAYVFFTSNKLGFSNFELFIVDSAGTREPVRVTYTDGFDGLPVPLPDGERIAWTSKRRGEQAQIMLARWNHEHALAALARAPERGATREKGTNKEDAP